MKNGKNAYVIIASIVIVCVCSGLLLSWLAETGYFYSPGNYENYNIIKAPEIYNINAYKYIYIIIVVSAVIALLLKKPHAIFPVAIIVFFITTGIQTIYQIKYFSTEFKTFSGKTLSEKNSHIFGLPYKFAVFCREHLSGEHRGELITDLDIMEPYGMTLHTRLYYHLYPINIAVKTDKPIDCYVIFEKKSAWDAIPKKNKAAYIFDQSNILAIKEELE